MRIPLEWLNEYVDITKKDPKDIAATFTALGLMQEKPIVDGVLELEHRMDRSDWLSIIGCARDYAAFEGLPLKYPELYTEKGKEPAERVKIAVECPEIVYRFNTRTFRGVTVKESPEWLKNRLESYGIHSKNNIVDITNYVMVEFGQPMHAQDLAKMKAQEIVIRCAKPGESVKTILGEDVEVSKGQFVLTQAGEPTVIGGIVGGIATAVDENTKDIVLDSGNYNQVNVRRSSRKLKIQNETVLRYDKFLHPEACRLAIERATKLILELAGGEYYENEDWYPKKWAFTKMTLRYDRVRKIGGMLVEPSRIKEILNALEYKILDESPESLDVEVPYFRTDVAVEDDIIADIYRINDYNNIPVVKISSAPPKEITPKIYRFEQKLRDIMVGFGFHEHITDPLVPSEKNIGDQITLKNSLTADKSSLRTDIAQTLSPVSETYKKHRIDEIMIFEIGRTYHNVENKYVESRELEAIIDSEMPAVTRVKLVKGMLSALLQHLGVTEYSLTNENITIENTIIGKLKLNGFKIFTDKLIKFDGIPNRVESEIVNYTKENFSFVMDKTQSLGEIYETIREQSTDIKDVVILEIRVDDVKTALVEVIYTTSDTQKIRGKILEALEKMDVKLRG